jgi:hypothetical protein
MAALDGLAEAMLSAAKAAAQRRKKICSQVWKGIARWRDVLPTRAFLVARTRTAGEIEHQLRCECRDKGNWIRSGNSSGSAA